MQISEVKRDLKTMLGKGIIEKSSLERVSPSAIVRKSSRNLRICTDNRMFNNATTVTSYLLPNIVETLDRLKDALCFTITR